MSSITIYDLGAELGLSHITLKQYVRRLGIKTHRLRVKSKGNQACSALTQEQANIVRQWREDNGFTGKPFGMEESA